MTLSALTLALLTTITWGLWSVLVKLATRSLAPATAMVLSYLTAVTVAVAYVLTAGRIPTPTATGTVYAVLGGVFASVGAITFYTALSRGEAAIVTPVSGMYFVVAALAGVVLLGESLGLRQVAGIGCAVLAVALLGS